MDEYFDAPTPPGVDFQDASSAVAVSLYDQYRRARVDKAAHKVRREIGEQFRLTTPLDLAGRPSEVVPGKWLSSMLPAEDPGTLGLDAAERSVRLLMHLLRSEEQHDNAAHSVSVLAARASAVRGALLAKVVGLAGEGVAGGVGAIVDPSGSLLPSDELITEAYVAMAVPSVLADLVGQAVECYAEATARRQPAVRRALVVAEVTAQALSPTLDAVLPPPFRFLRIGPDTPSPMIERHVGASGGDPSDGRALSRLSEQQLYGTRLGHFGAFGAQEWRDNDWVWGRMDAAAHLCRALGLHDPEVVSTAQTLVVAASEYVPGWLERLADEPDT